MKKLIALALALATTACAPQPTAQEQAVQQEVDARVQAEIREQQRIQALRQQNPDVNWLSIGIQTGKYSEDIAGEVYRTYNECNENRTYEDTVCVPVAALPESYWNTK